MSGGAPSEPAAVYRCASCGGSSTLRQMYHMACSNHTVCAEFLRWWCNDGAALSECAGGGGSTLQQDHFHIGIVSVH